VCSVNTFGFLYIVLCKNVGSLNLLKKFSHLVGGHLAIALGKLHQLSFLLPRFLDSYNTVCLNE
jgi:hypothetical protein